MSLIEDMELKKSEKRISIFSSKKYDAKKELPHQDNSVKIILEKNYIRLAVVSLETGDRTKNTWYKNVNLSGSCIKYIQSDSQIEIEKRSHISRLGQKEFQKGRLSTVKINNQGQLTSVEIQEFEDNKPLSTNLCTIFQKRVEEFYEYINNPYYNAKLEKADYYKIGFDGKGQATWLEELNDDNGKKLAVDKYAEVPLINIFNNSQDGGAEAIINLSSNEAIKNLLSQVSAAVFERGKQIIKNRP